MEYINGWNEVRNVLEKKMKNWPELEEWNVIIRIFTDRDALKSRQGNEDVYRHIDKKKKVLVLAFNPDPCSDAEMEGSLIMSEFVLLKRAKEL